MRNNNSFKKKSRNKIYLILFLYIICVLSSSNVSASTLLTEMGSEVDDRVSVISSAAASLPVFTTRASSTGIWQRNTGVWTNQGTDIDWTGIAAWNSSGNYLFAGTLISPRHLVMASHYAIPIGSTVVFVKNDNTIVTRTLTNLTNLGNDITIGILDSAVPSGIAYYDLPPTMSDIISRIGIPGYDGTLGTNVYQYNIPIISFDQEKKASVHLISRVSDLELDHGVYTTAESTLRTPFSHPTVPGDSGNPMFFLIDNTPILASLHTYTISGTYYGSFVSQINNAMDSLSGFNEYSPTVFSLSGYVTANTGQPDLVTASDTNIDNDNITSVTTPEVEISCVSGATVKLYSNNIEVSSGTCTSGLYSYTFGTLSDGNYVLNATQTSGASISATSTSLTITIDSSAPTTPISAPDLLSVSDTGTSSTDNQTSDSYPKFSVSCDSGNTVDLYVNNAIMGSASCTGSTVILQASTAITYGAKTIYYKQKDLAGNTSGASPSITVGFNTDQSSILNIDGTLDTTFNSGGTGANSAIYSIKYQASTGKYIIAGAFSTYNTSSGTTNVGRIARLNADGTLDTTFNSGGTGANSAITFMDFQSDGKIIIFGSFTSYNTSSGTTTVGRIARLNSDGTLDTTFNSGGVGFSSSISSCTLSGPETCSIIIDGQDRIVLTIHSNSYTYNGSTPSHRYIIRLTSNGTLDSSFLSGGNGLGTIPGRTRLLLLESGKYMLFANPTTLGFHDSTNGTTTGQFFRLNNDGSRDMTFSANTTNFSASTLGLEMYEDRDTNDIFLSTNSTYQGATFNGNPVNTVLLKISSDGSTADSSYNTGNPADGTRILSLNYLGDGRFLMSFSTSALSSNFSWPGLTVPSLTAPIYATLIINRSGVDSSYNNRAVSKTYSSYIDSLGRLIIAGSFTTYDGISAGNIARITKSTLPSLSRFVSISSNNTYKIGQTVDIAAILSEPVRPGSTMNVTLNTGSSVTLTTSATSTSLTGVYTVSENDSTSDLLVSSISSASVVDTLGSTVTSFSVPADNIDDTSDIVVDGVRPTAHTPQLDSSSDTGISNSDNITNDLTPSFIVQCLSGETVSLYNSSTLIESGTCSGSSITITTPILTAGTYNVVNVVTSANGNTSSTSTPALVIILDSEYSGSTPAMPDLDTSSDSGTSHSDNYTSDITPTISGSCTSGELVLLSIDGDIPVELSCTSSVYTYTAPRLTQTTHSFVAAYKDVAGNTSYSSEPLFVSISDSADIPLTVVIPTTSSGSNIFVVSALRARSAEIVSAPKSNISIPMKPSVLDTIKDKITLPEKDNKVCTPYLTSLMGYGQNNQVDEVKKLQDFLNKYNNANLEVGGVYDLQTKRAVEDFQVLYAKHILYPWGLKKPTGNVYRTTLAKINAMVCASTYGCPYFTEYHKQGDESQDIKKIKSFLNILNPQGQLDSSNAIYDSKTKVQIMNFQNRYKDTVLKPWKLTNATGYWYKSTRASANEIMECNEVVSY